MQRIELPLEPSSILVLRQIWHPRRKPCRTECRIIHVRWILLPWTNHFVWKNRQMIGECLDKRRINEDDVCTLLQPTTNFIYQQNTFVTIMLTWKTKYRFYWFTHLLRMWKGIETKCEEAWNQIRRPERTAKGFDCTQCMKPLSQKISIKANVSQQSASKRQKIKRMNESLKSHWTQWRRTRFDSLLFFFLLN